MAAQRPIPGPAAPHSQAGRVNAQPTTTQRICERYCWQPPDPAVPVFYKSAVPVLLEDRCPMKLFVGYLDDEPVASSELFLSGRIAGLYSVCTRRECRGRGIGSALTWVALDYARCRGIPTAVLQSSNDGKGLYTRLGFSVYCDFAEFTTD